MENGAYQRDVAEVTIGHGLRTGAATQKWPAVMSTVFMLAGENSRTVASNVGKKLAEINAFPSRALLQPPPTIVPAW